MGRRKFPSISPIVLILYLATGPGCFYGHPVVGILPGEISEDDTSALFLAALSGGGLTASATIPGTPDPTLSNTAIFLYTGANTTGDFRNGQATARLGADLLCQNNRPTFSPDNSCSTIHAMVSLTDTDEIRDMVANYGVPTDRPVQGPTGGAVVQIAADWNDLLNAATPLAQNLQAAGITTARWRSFSDSDSSLSIRNCSGGTRNSGGTGEYGDSDTTGTQWISDTFQFCSDTLRLVCVCF